MLSKQQSLFLSTIAIVYGVMAKPCEMALADTFFSLYTGSSFTLNSDIHVQQPGTGTDATFHDVSWDAKPFTNPPYYGVRLSHFFESAPSWGVMLDFTHYKIFAQTNQIVAASGTFNGVPINGSAPLNQSVQKFNISHGVNLLALNALYRWTVQASAVFPHGRLQPYVGGGPVYYILHPENTINNINNNEGYQGSGFGYQVLAGVHYDLTRHIGLFAETKFNSGDARVDTANQGQADTPLRTFHLLGGISFGF